MSSKKESKNGEEGKENESCQFKGLLCGRNVPNEDQNPHFY